LVTFLSRFFIRSDTNVTGSGLPDQGPEGSFLDREGIQGQTQRNVHGTGLLMQSKSKTEVYSQVERDGRLKKEGCLESLKTSSFY
jgi:hypothetical protein